MDSQVIDVRQDDEWLQVLNECYLYDFYHCPSYHVLSIRETRDKAILFAYQEGDYTIAIPLIIRPVNEIAGLESCQYNDATSVYGYSGPVASHATIPGKVVENFQADLLQYLKDEDVVCAFSRLHPLMSQQLILEGLGNTVRQGQTVSIDLTLPVDDQFSRFRPSSRSGIRKLRRAGLHCKDDQTAEHLNDFVEIYQETMKRVNAKEEYFFDKGYFQDLLGARDFAMHLFACFVGDEMACGGVFSLCKGIVQDHLNGTRSEYLKLAPTKLLIDEVRLWANGVGAYCFHLGGGLGAEEDSLFHFKSGFSDSVHTFNVWQLVVLADEYADICRDKMLWNESKGFGRMTANYFPAYRAPAT